MPPLFPKRHSIKKRKSLRMLKTPKTRKNQRTKRKLQSKIHHSQQSQQSLRNKIKRLFSDNMFLQYDKNDEKYKDTNTTYGEMDYEGIEQLKKSHFENCDCFIDIGSGRGKLCIYMATYPEIKKSIGIEIVKERHDFAENMRQKLDSLKDKIVFLNEDFLKIDIQNLIGENKKPCIWISNLCFPQNVTESIFEKLVQELPKKSVIACSNKVEITEKLDSLKLIDNKSIPMSWNKTSNVHVYTIE